MAAFHVLLATLAEAHVGQPLCSLLSGTAGWDLLDGHSWYIRLVASAKMFLISPAFPIGAGTPVRSERVVDSLLPDADLDGNVISARGGGKVRVP